jgi:hypothetical protein
VVAFGGSGSAGSPKSGFRSNKRPASKKRRVAKRIMALEEDI